MVPELVFTLMGLCVLSLLAGYPAWRRWRHRRLHGQPFPAAWRKLLQKKWALYRHLPPPLQKRLQGMIQVMLADVPFVGCDGLVVTDDMRVMVAAQACLLVLERPGPPYPELRQVLLYPGPFVVDAQHPQPGGVISQGREVRLGESWQHGQVVLSWPDALAGALTGQWAPAQASDNESRLHPATNVVIHEFAHQLDQETGPANGAPALRPGQSARTWAQTFQREFEDLRWLADAGEPTLIDPYGATAPEEFFAVAAEAFFMQPRAMAEQHPALFGQLQRYFQLMPHTWD